MARNDGMSVRPNSSAKQEAKLLMAAPSVNIVSEEDRRYVFPKSLGACVDRLQELDLKKDKIRALLKEAEEEYTALENYLIDTIPKSELQGATGRIASVKLDPKTVANAKDWDKIYSYIKKTSAWDLLYKRLNNKACNDRWEAKRVLPGIEPFRVVKLKLTALKGKPR